MPLTGFPCIGRLFGRLISGQRPMRGIMDPLQSLDGSLPGFGLRPHAAAPVGSVGVTSIRPDQALQPIARTTRRGRKIVFALLWGKWHASAYDLVTISRHPAGIVES
jgi:hypothetical protein